MKKIIVSDVTPIMSEEGKKLSFREKLMIASAIDASGADIICLPALINSKENEVIYKTVADEVKNATVCVCVGSTVEDVETAWNTVKGSKKPMLSVAMPVSTAKMEYEYHLKANSMRDKILELCKKAKEYCEKVEFVALDAFRVEKDFLLSIVKGLEEIGVENIVLSDDAGISFPEEFASLVKAVKAESQIKVTVESNDSLKMAAANTVASIMAGADGVRVSVVGERLRPAVFSDIIRAKGNNMGVTCSIDATKIYSVTAPIVELDEVESSNISLSAKLQKEATLSEVCEFVKKLGYELSDEDNGKVYEEFKRVILKTEVMGVKEMEAIIASTAMQVPSTYHLVNYIVNSGNVIPPTANIILEKNGEKLSGVATGDGPIDAAIQAIEQVIGHHYELDDFQVHSVTKGREAVGSSIIRLRANGKLYSGNGVSTDIIGACIRAFINALNKIVYEEN